MIWYLVISVILNGLATNAQDPQATTLTPDARCQTKVNTTLDQCLSSFIYKWDDIRKVKPQIDALVYPLWTLTAEELRSLCIRVEEAQETCGPTAVEKCEKNEVARFVQQNFIYACNSKPGSIFADSADCLLSTINSKQDCLMLLKKNEDEKADGCSQLNNFFKCIHDDVQKSCKAKGVAALVHGIDRFGCDVSKLDARIGAQDQPTPNCLPPDWQGVTNCFQPLLNMWAEIRDNDTSLLESGFPVFKFDRADMAKMCEMVHGVRDQCSLQIQRCPSHQLPEFTNSLLGLACGTQQAVFFLSYDCIKRTIAENTQCHAYTVGAWQPGHLKEVCGRLPSFYKCLEKPVAAKCANDGVNVLAQSIRQFGCELNAESLPAGGAPVTQPQPPTIPVTVAPTTIAALPPAPATAGAGPPGSNNGPAAPGTNIFQAGAPVQPALPTPAPVPFLNGAPANPPPLAPLVPGPQEAIFKLPVANQQQQAPAVASTVPVPQPAAPTQVTAQQPVAQAQVTPAVQSPSAAAPAASAPAPAAPAPAAPAPAQPAAAQTPQPAQPVPSQPTAQPAAAPAVPAAAAPVPAGTAAVPVPAPVPAQPQVPAQVPVPALTPAPTPAPTTPTPSPTTTAAPTPIPGERKPVQPIPLVPQLLEVCDTERRNQARKCLHPMFKRWVLIHTRMITETHRANLTFPIYHYARAEVMELCDQYATAFLQCPFAVFQECLRDEVVFLANAILGYTCSPQNLHEFTRHFDCISTLIRARNQCSEPISGPLLIGRDETSRCAGVKKFYECNSLSIKETCTTAAERVFRETVRQFGCELDNKP